MDAKIIKRPHAFQGYASSYNFEILNSLNPELQLKNTESSIRNKLIEFLSELKDFKFVATLAFGFKKIENYNKQNLAPFIQTQKAETIINEIDIDDVFESIYTTIISNIQKLLRKISGWIIDSVIDHNINISKYKPLAGRSYTKFPKQLDHPRKGLINIQNIDDNEFLKWCLVRYLYPTDYNPRRIVLKLMVNRRLSCLKKVNTLN